MIFFDSLSIDSYRLGSGSGSIVIGAVSVLILDISLSARLSWLTGLSSLLCRLALLPPLTVQSSPAVPGIAAAGGRSAPRILLALAGLSSLRCSRSPVLSCAVRCSG